jgi:hypothetical protein
MIEVTFLGVEFLTGRVLGLAQKGWSEIVTPEFDPWS